MNRTPIVHTTDPEIMRSAMIETFGASGFSAAAEGFEGFGSYVQLDGAGFGFCRYAAPAVAEFGETDSARLHIVLNGSARATIGASAVDLDPQHWGVASAGVPARFEFAAGYKAMILQFSDAALNATLEAMLGVKPRGKMVLAPQVRSDQRGANSLHQFAAYLARQVDLTQPMLPPLMLREMKEALIVSFLCVARHNYSDRLDKDAPDTAPDYVRVAEDYIEASWNRAITINDLAQVTNVGIRSLFKAFQKHRGYSPMAFAKSVRLNRARAMLAQGDPARSVTSVAFACGFGNLGHFANDYRRKHGELPSETLARAR